MQGKDTFICFIDYKKAFDSIERNLLLFKLSHVGITGNMYRAISSLYSNPRSRVILNENEPNILIAQLALNKAIALAPHFSQYS